MARNFFHGYDYEKCHSAKLLGTRLYVLDYVISHRTDAFITSYRNGRVFFHMTREDIAMAVGVDVQSVTVAFRFLKKLGLVDTYYERAAKKLYIAPIMDKCNEFIFHEEAKPEKKEESVLFDYVEKKYSDEAENIVMKAVSRNKDLFGNKLPKEGEEPTKAFTKACQFVDSIYRGSVLNSRLHAAISTLDASRSSFYIDGWKETLEACKGDWSAINKLIMSSIKNYRMMHDANRMPIKKSILPRDISAWFEDNYSNCSFFVFSFNEPYLIADRNEEKLADEIFDKLPEAARVGGNRLFGLNTTMPDGQFWTNVREMVEWGDALCMHDHNAFYWISGGAELPNRFCQYLIDNGITCSLATTSIRKAVECSGPWTWYLSEMIAKHGLDSDILGCASAKEIGSYYEKREA